MISVAMLVGIESILVAGCLLLSLFTFSPLLPDLPAPAWLPWETLDRTASVSTIAVLAGLAVYWLLGFLKTRFWSFLILAIVGLALQVPAVLSYDQVDWLFFFTQRHWFDPPASSLEVGFYFLLNLAILVLLYRTILLGEQQRTVRRQGVDELESRQLLLHQYLFVVGLVFSSLALAGGLVSLSIGLGGIGNLLERSPWTVLTIGGLATLIISATLLYWMRDSEAG